MSAWHNLTAILLVTTLCSVSTSIVAQTGSSHPGVAEDPVGDQMLRSPTGNTTAPSGYEDVDVVRIWIENETATGLDLGVKLAQWERPPAQSGAARTGFRSVQLGLNVLGQDYRILLFGAGCQESFGETHATLQVWNPGSATYRQIGCLNVTVDAASATALVHVSKSDLLDGSGLAARRGTPIDGFYAIASSYVDAFTAVPMVAFGVGDPPEVVDRAPDVDGAPTFRLQVSDGTQGVIELSSPTPIRFSNGESTTMVFEVLVENLGTNVETVFLELRDLESSWTGRVPARVRLDPTGSATVPVILSTEFTHRHGETGVFHLVAKTATDGTESRLPLGIRWADVPQPAGHHNVLYLHSKPTSFGTALDPVSETVSPQVALWSNTLQKDPDPNATDGPTKSNWYAHRQTETGAEFYQGWSFPLDPALLIGLDLDHQVEGIAQVAIESGIGDVVSRLSVQLLYCDPTNTDGVHPGFANCIRGSWFPLIEGTLDPVTPGQRSKTTYMVPLKADPSRDLVPYVPGSNVRIHVEYLHNQAALGFDPASPTLFLPESQITLPLSEYHDPIDQAFAEVGSLELGALSPFEKPANPGRSSVYRFTIKNEAQTEQELKVSVEGHNIEWARISQPELTLGPGESKEFVVTVDVPIDAAEGERAELFVLVENIDDPATVAIARLRTTVVADRDIPNEAAEDGLDAGNGTPTTSALIAMGVIGALAIMGRRRK